MINNYINKSKTKRFVSSDRNKSSQSKSFFKSDKSDYIYNLKFLKHSNIFDPGKEDLESRRRANEYLKRLTEEEPLRKSMNFTYQTTNIIDTKCNMDDQSINSKFNLKYYESVNSLQRCLECKVKLNKQEELMLHVLKSGPNLEEVDLLEYYRNSLKMKIKHESTEKLIFKILEGKLLNNQELADLFFNTLRNKEVLSLKDELIIKILRADENLSNINVDEVILLLMKCSQDKNISFKKEVILKLINCDDKLYHFDFKDLYARQIKFKNYLDRRDNLIINALKGDPELFSVYDILHDEIKFQLRTKVENNNYNATLRERLLHSTFQSPDNLEKLDLETFIKAIYKNKFPLSIKEELILKAISHNENLDYCDLSKIIKQIYRRKKLLDVEYTYTTRESLILNAFESDEFLKNFNIDQYVNILYSRKNVLDARDNLVMISLNAKRSLDNIDLNESFKISITNKKNRTLREEFIFRISCADTDLNNLETTDLLKEHLDNKEKYYKSNNMNFSFCEQLILRILKSGRDVACDVSDVELKYLINLKDSNAPMTRKQQLLLRIYKGRDDLLDVDLTPSTIHNLQNKEILCKKEQFLLKILESDDELSNMNILDVTYQNLIIKSDKTPMDLLIMKVYEKKINEITQKYEMVNSSQQISSYIKNMYLFQPKNRRYLHYYLKKRSFNFTYKGRETVIEYYNFESKDLQLSLTSRFYLQIDKTMNKIDNLVRWEKFMHQLVKKKDKAFIYKYINSYAHNKQKVGKSLISSLSKLNKPKSLIKFDYDYMIYASQIYLNAQLLKNIRLNLNPFAKEKIIKLFRIEPQYVDKNILKFFNYTCNTHRIRSEVKISSEYFSYSNVSNLISKNLINIPAFEKFPLDRITHEAWKMLDYYDHDIVHVHEFEGYVFLCYLFATFYEVYYSIISNSRNEKMDIKEYIQWWNSMKITHNNPFREFHQMGAKNELCVSYEEFCKFMVRYWFLENVESASVDLKFILKFVYFYGFYSEDDECKGVFNSIMYKRNKKYITKTELGQYFSCKATGFSINNAKKISTMMRKIASRYDGGDSNINYQELSNMFFYIEAFFDVFYMLLYIDNDNSYEISLKEWKPKYKYLYLPPTLRLGEERSFKQFDKGNKGQIAIDTLYLLYADEWYKYKLEMDCMTKQFNSEITKYMAEVDLDEDTDFVKNIVIGKDKLAEHKIEQRKDRLMQHLKQNKSKDKDSEEEEEDMYLQSHIVSKSTRDNTAFSFKSPSSINSKV